MVGRPDRRDAEGVGEPAALGRGAIDQVGAEDQRAIRQHHDLVAFRLVVLARVEDHVALAPGDAPIRRRRELGRPFKGEGVALASASGPSTATFSGPKDSFCSIS